MKIIALIAVILANFVIAAAQLPFAEFDKVKEIKLLESSRDDVIKILASDSLTFSDISRYQDFFMMDANVRIKYSSGNCSDEYEDWNVPQLKVTKISIDPKDNLEIKSAGKDFLQKVGIDFSKLQKEKIYEVGKGRYVYYNKTAGIAVTTRGGSISTISFSPPIKDYSRLCNKDEVQKYYSSKKWNRYPEDKKTIFDFNNAANVVELNLNQTEITADSDDKKQIVVSTIAVDPENDVLTYNYYVPAGKIVGQGAKVVWDLSGVKPGIYKITAGVDDGCGVCGRYLSKIITVKSCPDCSNK